MDIVNGKDVVVYIYDGGIWKLYACGKSCTFTIETEFIETSVAGYGVNATFLPTKNSFTGTLEGVVSLEVGSVLNYPDLQLRQTNHELLLMRFTRTSRLGAVYTSEVNFYILSSSDTGSFDAANVFTIELKGTGILGQIFTQPIPPAGGVTLRYEYTAAGGESFFSDPSLINKYILEANKDGAGFRVILNGTPVNKEVKYTIGTGRFDFSVPFEPGEELYIIYMDL